jgi:hypothetical protein
MITLTAITHISPVSKRHSGHGWWADHLQIAGSIRTRGRRDCSVFTTLALTLALAAALQWPVVLAVALGVAPQ